MNGEELFGLYQKYIIQKVDGRPIDPNACYFVLRYDEDDAHGLASRRALTAYATAIRPHNPRLADDLKEAVRAYEEEQADGH